MNEGPATGGVVTKPTLALMGEDLWEGALVPTSVYEQWIRDAEYYQGCIKLSDEFLRMTDEERQAKVKEFFDQCFKRAQ